ncbi:MAG: hypothetical protein JEZ02_18095 [Desulfatibacillum sp.]|nr:hypothetical protein [Desulfatibacillum sp.]
MHCFNHQDTPAVGICQSCGKALCMECLAQVYNGLACKDSCEDRVILMNRIMDANAQMVTATKAQMKAFEILEFFIGMVFFALAYYAFKIMGWPAGLVLGVTGFLAIFHVIFRQQKKARFPDLE